MLSLHTGSDSWSGKGDLYCFAVNGESTHQEISVCLSSWLGNQSLFTKARSIQLANATLLVNSPNELMTSMEVLTQVETSSRPNGKASEYKMLGWPFVEDYPFYLNNDLNPTVAKHLKHGTLIIEPRAGDTDGCGPSNF